jgi:hypothetical protein
MIVVHINLSGKKVLKFARDLPGGKMCGGSACRSQSKVASRIARGSGTLSEYDGDMADALALGTSTATVRKTRMLFS